MGHVIEVDWVLNSVTRRLGHQGFRRVDGKPKQVLMVVYTGEPNPVFDRQCCNLLAEQMKRGLVDPGEALEALTQAGNHDADPATDGPGPNAA